MAMLLLLSSAFALCPSAPTLRDDNPSLSMLSQNLQFIAVGIRRDERAALLNRWLAGEGADVDLLLLSEARDPSALRAQLPGWCFYAQTGGGGDYRWAPENSRSPGGLVLGVRDRADGTVRDIGASAGRAYRSRAVTLAEGWLGRVAGFVKGWAAANVAGASVRWTHTQASYARRPERGAGWEREGRAGVGRAGQFAELAATMTRDEPTLLTGDLNLLDGFYAPDPEVDARLARARGIDDDTVKAFFERTGMALFGGSRCPNGSFMGSVDSSKTSRSVFAGATFDRVGINEAFAERFPSTIVECAEIREGFLRVSDHLGVRVTVTE